MICDIWYIRDIVGSDDFIFYRCGLPLVPPNKTTIKTGNGQEFLFEDPDYNISEGRFEFYLDEIEESEINDYKALGWFLYSEFEPPEE